VKLELLPVTILTGPNVVGKSFLLRAVYAMLTPCSQGAPDVATAISRLCNDITCVEPSWTVKRDRTMRMPEKPGIGVEVVEERLRKCVKNRIEFKKTA
jgi:hypothetical protein